MLYRKRNCQYKYQSRKYMLDQIDKFQRHSFIFYLPQYHMSLRLVSVFALYTTHHPPPTTSITLERVLGQFRGFS